MWTCRHCGHDLPQGNVEPERDDGGFFFVCPDCKLRNELIAVRHGGPDDPLELTQLKS